MKILYVNDVMDYVVHGFLPSLERRGHTIEILPLRLYSKLSQWWMMIRTIQEFQPDIVLTPGWSIGHFDVRQYNEVIHALHVPHVYWATEDPVFFEECSLAFAPFADYVFTTTEEYLPRYEAMGIQSSLLLFGCNPEVHRKVAPTPKYTHDIVLVANNYPKFPPELECRRRAIRTVLLPLIEAGLDVKAFGVDWTDSEADITIPPEFYGGYCPYLENPQAYSSAKIVLGVHWDDSSRTQTSIRTYEILGSGAFYLTYYTPAHENLFENHKHLVWSTSPEETVDLVDYYLKHDRERERIAAAGQALVYEKHSYDRRAVEFETALTPFLAERRRRPVQVLPLNPDSE